MESARTILRGEAGFPPRLAAIDDAPARLRVRGELGDAGRVRAAVVGSRGCDGYGRAMAREIAAGLARAGVLVVSGGARGVDAEAHRAAVEAGGHTVAVLGTGLDRTYPPEHEGLFRRIVEAGGALVSELEDGAEVRGWAFPRRNRIVSALCDVVVVVQAAAGSGALLTAGWARQQGVPVMAVPGEAGNPLSAGPHELLRGGARLAAGAGDVLAALGLSGPAQLALGEAAVPTGLPPGTAAVLAALSRTPRHADELARAAGTGAGETLAALLELEVEGLAEQRPGQRYLRRSPQ